jgi:hypothetical protein
MVGTGGRSAEPHTVSGKAVGKKQMGTARKPAGGSGGSEGSMAVSRKDPPPGYTAPKQQISVSKPIASGLKKTWHKAEAEACQTEQQAMDSDDYSKKKKARR